MLFLFNSEQRFRAGMLLPTFPIPFRVSLSKGISIRGLGTLLNQKLRGHFYTRWVLSLISFNLGGLFIWTLFHFSRFYSQQSINKSNKIYKCEGCPCYAFSQFKQYSPSFKSGKAVLQKNCFYAEKQSGFIQVRKRVNKT